MEKVAIQEERKRLTGKHRELSTKSSAVVKCALGVIKTVQSMSWNSVYDIL